MKVVHLSEQEIQVVLQLFDAALKKDGLAACRNVFILATKFEEAKDVEEETND